MAAKRKIQNILSNFDHEIDDVKRLTEDLYKAFGVDLVDLYKEFLGFLTAEQANTIDMFRDYFLHGCVCDLIKKIEVSSQRVRLTGGRILCILDRLRVGYGYHLYPFNIMDYFPSVGNIIYGWW